MPRFGDSVVRLTGRTFRMSKRFLVLEKKSYRHNLGLPFLAGLAELERTAPEEDPSRWSDDRIRKAIAFYYCYCTSHADYRPEWYRRLITARPKIVAEVQVQFTIRTATESTWYSGSAGCPRHTEKRLRIVSLSCLIPPISRYTATTRWCPSASSASVMRISTLRLSRFRNANRRSTLKRSKSPFFRRDTSA